MAERQAFEKTFQPRIEPLKSLAKRKEEQDKDTKSENYNNIKAEQENGMLGTRL